MSHFTNIKTRFQNLVYLEIALNKLHIATVRKLSELDIVIPQSNGHDIIFFWNGKEYELIVDRDYWEQADSIESFINKIAQQYAVETINRESKEIGFQPSKYLRHMDGSNTLILERWIST